LLERVYPMCWKYEVLLSMSRASAKDTLRFSVDMVAYAGDARIFSSPRLGNGAA
jgi:hypothetical protein